MEKDIDKISKNADTDIVIRIDDFGGKVGLTIREFIRGERYTGFTKAGTRIPADKFKQFKAAINSIDEKDLEPEDTKQEPPDTKTDETSSEQKEDSISNDSEEEIEEQAI